jgi:hypothetical protein
VGEAEHAAATNAFGQNEKQREHRLGERSRARVSNLVKTGLGVSQAGPTSFVAYS